MFELTDRIAIVTGSSRGIGKGIALGFAKAGAHIVAAARSISEIEATAEEARFFGRRALAVPTDVRDREQVAAMVHKTLEHFGRIDILVNNAGIYPPCSFLDMTESDWNDIIVTNVTGIFLCTKAVGKVMVEQKKGNIINIGSIAGLQPSPGQVNYGASKAAIMNMTRSLAVEWAPYNIRVNAIAPVGIATDSGGKFYRSLTPEARKLHRQGVPVGHYGRPEDIAAAAIFLASDDAEFITGCILGVDGGGLPVIVPSGGFSFAQTV